MVLLFPLPADGTSDIRNLISYFTERSRNLMKTIHGGDIYRNPVDLDFSVNMNPLGMPQSVMEAIFAAVKECHTYPDIHAEKLSLAVGAMLGIAPETLLFGNGASELFLAVVHALKPRKIVIPVPSFYGYEHAAQAVAETIVYVSMKEENDFYPDHSLFEALQEDVDMIFLANPNNPTGMLIKREDMIRLATYCREKQIIMVLDECFIEFCGEEFSMLGFLEQFPNLVVIRAFTKSFSIPGVRLGYLISQDPSIRDAVLRQLPEWNLSTFAQAAGIACAGEMGFLKRTIPYLKKEREFLKSGLETILQPDCKIYSGAANFLLIKSPLLLYKKFLEHGILIRDCGNFRGLSDGFYRIAVKTREENEKLLRIAGEINWNESNMYCQKTLKNEALKS